MTAIEVIDVCYAYNRKSGQVLKGITMGCEKGTINTLLGLNGSGKTTLMKIMAGLNKPESGCVLFEGNDLFGMTIKQRSQVVSYVSQIGGTVGDYSVEEYLLFGTTNRLEFYQSPSDKERDAVDQSIDRLGIRHLKSKKLGELSGGQRQMISICGALIQNTPVILLDEPTSALDMRNQHLVLRKLKDIAEKEDKTIVLSTHNPNHALYLDSNVLLIKDGATIGGGRAREMIRADILASMYGDSICSGRELEYDEVSFRD